MRTKLEKILMASIAIMAIGAILAGTQTLAKTSTMQKAIETLAINACQDQNEQITVSIDWEQWQIYCLNGQKVEKTIKMLEETVGRGEVSDTR